jgi:DNA-binding transcriptional ArsR family regulator
MLIDSEERLCVCDLSDVLDMKIPAVSQHLRKLKDAGIVKTEREGTVIYYRISEESHQTISSILLLLPNHKIAL